MQQGYWALEGQVRASALELARLQQCVEVAMTQPRVHEVEGCVRQGQLEAALLGQTVKELQSDKARLEWHLAGLQQEVLALRAEMGQVVGEGQRVSLVIIFFGC